MAHNLNTANGRASMFYIAETPWHKLGTQLDKPATAEEAIAAAQLDYSVNKYPLYIHPDEGLHVAVDGHYATVREDTKDVLGVVGSRYVPIQNHDAFRFFDALVGQGEAIYHTAGALGKGERIWILAKLPDYIKVKGEDIVEKYLLLTNTHDGSGTVRAKLTPIRVVCNNTLTAALEGSDQEVHIAHTANAVNRLEEAHKILGLANRVFEQLHAIYFNMARIPCSDRDFMAYVKTLVPDNEMAENHARTEAIRTDIQVAYSMVTQGAQGTWWGAFNAISEYTDHFQTAKTNHDNMLHSMWFGGREQLKKQAFRLAVDTMQ